MKMPMDLTEVKLRRKDVFEGKIMTVHVDDVRLPNGEEATREVVDHVDGAAVLALDEANRVLVVRQYRYVFGKVLDELPAGKLDPGEDPVTGALRELEEEDPQLHIVWDSRLGEIRAQLMGQVQIEVLRSLVLERFDTAIEVEEGRILYKETIALSLIHI